MNCLDAYDFGLRLKELRAKKQMSQKDVAARLDVVPETISAYERNIQTPRLEILIQLAILYNSSVDYILGFDKRSHLYLDDLPEYQQDAILNMVDTMKDTFALIERKSTDSQEGTL